MKNGLVEVGDIVLYHEPSDGRDWPALVLDFNGDSFHLQVFRPRGNHWAWAVEGVQPARFSQRD